MKVLFLGLGGVGQRHLRNFHEITNGENEYFTISNRLKKSEISNSLKIDNSVNIFEKYSINIVPNLEEAFKVQPKLSFVSSPSSFHYEQTKLALQNGSNVYLEKPATLTKNECDELVSISNTSSLKISVSFQLRFMPWLNEAKKIIDSGKYGRPLFISATVSEYMPSWHTYENYAESYASKKELGGGVVLTQIHEIDYLIYLFQDIYFQDSMVGKFSDLNIDVEDIAFSLLKTKYNGYDVPIQLSQDYLGQPKRRDLIIQFKDVKLVCDFLKGNVSIQSADKILENHEYKNFNRNDAFILQLKRYLENLSSNKELNTPVTLQEASKGIEIAEQIKKKYIQNTF